METDIFVRKEYLEAEEIIFKPDGLYKLFVITGSRGEGMSTLLIMVLS